MTQPPGEPRDPNQQPPHTRAFGPDDNPAIPPETSYGYSAAPPPPPPGNGGPGGSNGAPDGGGGGNRRTLYLSLAALVALILVIGLAALIVKGEGDDTSATGSATSTVTSSPTTSTTSTSTTSPTTQETTTTPTTTVVAGSVVYQLTGNGDVIGLRYRSGGDSVFVAATGTPWSQNTRVDDGNAELTAIVVRGPVTCTIMQAGELLSSATSNGGPLRCGAQLPG
ncbi:hypothetical protein GYA93_04870 [Gordonia desulfuricans]|uniref:Uncharacterized protein n=1 Tax=Gordonia desulfuricans TaxID=89051 RepID=A0A7K3LL76_9ACTN|nr:MULTISPECIES: hypothetical protein [Gordonia]EMP14219.1 hypothetical protein ISGA_2402 [Gordonia sp. NB41Y]NDK88913.1 hypothetical protein [Gordonia desulfuricans]WLP88924.1 hypothetical protein Q9K23_15065 [Gordonia sp. NB41Y]